MAEVAPLLTPQGWQLVTPVAASGAATGGAVGGTAGLALTAAGAGILLVAYLVAKRAANRAATAKGKSAPKGAAKNSSAAAGNGGARGLLNRLKPGGRASSGSGGAGSPGGGRSGGGRGRLRLPGGGKKSGTGPTGAGSTGGSKSGAGGPKKGTGRLAGLRGKLPGRKTGAAGSSGQKSAGGSRSGGSPAKSKGSGPGLVQRARNIGRARKLGAARERVLGQPGRGSRDAGAKPAGQKPGSVRRGLGYLANGRKAPAGDGQLKTGPKGGTIGRATGEPREGRLQKIGQLIPSGKRERLANRAAGATTPGGRSAPGGSAALVGRRGTSVVARRAIDNATSTPVGKRRRTMGGPGMPLLRRPTINKTGLARTGASRLANSPTSGPSPFAPVIEACATAAQSYSPENALRAIAWYEGMPQLIEALAGMFAAHARKNQEDFYLYPAAAEIANALGVKFAAYKGPCEDARAAFEAAHAEDLTKIRDPKPNQDKWDIVANQ
jgi:hypothetical protein